MQISEVVEPIDNDLVTFTKCDIFTPDNICALMASKLHPTGTLLEPAVGTGNLLKYINLNSYDIVDVYELKSDHLNQIQHKSINKYNKDFIKTNIDKSYDNIIMNPPYIKVQDLSEDYRHYLKSNFDILNCGLVDIYYAFIIKCLELLNENGRMVAITPNSYLYNKSSLNLRKYLFNNCFIEEIIDYKDAKVFDNASVYCCITVFTKTQKENLIYNNTNITYSNTKINYSLFNFNSLSNKTLNNICKITNGIATLRDKIFIHNVKLFNEPCWEQITNGSTNRYIIYPYKDGKIIEESLFRVTNPQTYNYLNENKVELSKRDKGNKIYPAWYAYGRSQAVKYSKKKCIYIPCFIDPKNITTSLFIKNGMLFQGALCIEPYNENDIERIVEYITTNINFINNNSSKRSGGWINISSRVLYEIPLD
jgi:adenine-specific DNA-methyltransferase